MVDYLHHHHFLLLPLLHLRNLDWEPSFCIFFHYMQKHMVLKKLAPLDDPFFVTSQMTQFSDHNGRGHYTQVLHVVKNSDDAPISLLCKKDHLIQEGKKGITDLCAVHLIRAINKKHRKHKSESRTI
jgi:hypothetical protein